MEKMQEYEVERIIDKKTTGRKEKKVEYCVKWMGIKRTSWVQMANLNCNRLVLEYERKCGPGPVIGAKRDAKGVSYLVQSKNNVDVEVITANDAQMFPIQIIEFLESKIVWEDAIEDVNFRANLAGSQNAVSTVVYATKRTSGELAYFFQCDNGEILIMSAQEAKVHHPHLVLEFLENSIA